MGKTYSIKARVRWLRTLSGLSARAVADASGIAHSLVSYIEDGTRVDPRSSTVAALAHTFGVKLDWLVSGEGPEPEREEVIAAVAAARAAREAA